MAKRKKESFDFRGLWDGLTQDPVTCHLSATRVWRELFKLKWTHEQPVELSLGEVLKIHPLILTALSCMPSPKLE